MSKINYQLTAIRGIAFDIDGVLSPSTVPCDANGIPSRMVNIKDGYALQLAVKCGLKIAIISGGVSQAMVDRYSALGITDIYMGVSEKADVFEKWLQHVGLKAEEVAYMGDDVPDIPVMLAAGLAIAPSDAAVDAKDAAQYITVAAGGYGAAREVLEQILRAQGLWMAHSKAFGW